MRVLLCIFVFFASFYVFPSCTKTGTSTHDTTVIIHKDTIIIKDTITSIDTLVLVNPKNPITGYWTGLYYIDANPSYGSFFYGWSIFPDHTIIQQGGAQNGVNWTAKGTWTLAADSTFICDIQSTDPSESDPSLGIVTEHITAKYSAANGTLSNGHFTYTNGSNTTGSFTLKRVGNQ